MVFIVEPLHDSVHFRLGAHFDTEKGDEQRLADQKVRFLGDIQSMSLPFALRPGLVIRYGANDRPSQDGFAIT